MQAQAPQTAEFRAAFAYLAELIAPGSPARTRLEGMERGDARKVELGGGVFAIEQVYETKSRAEGFFESHRRFTDLQVVVEGGELMEVTDIGRVTVHQPYTADRDLITYHDVADASQLRISAGEAAIFFPVDVHMPSLRLHAQTLLVRKSVVKVPAG